MSKRKWQYMVRSDASLPEGATSPIMDDFQMQDWFDKMDAKGWEFVGSCQKFWLDHTVQNFMVFRKPYISKKGKKQ